MESSPLLDQSLAQRAIRMYNENVALMAAERLVCRYFPSTAEVFDPAAIPERVVLLDAVWQTQMFRDRGALARVIRAITQKATWMQSVIESLAEDALASNPHSVADAAAQLLPVIVEAEADPDDEGAKRHYSFATKFLHWSSRVHFPIMDQRARTAIYSIQRDRKIRPWVPSQTGAKHYSEDYPRWVEFYGRAIREMAAADRDHLVALDLSTQPSSGACRNSLLRVMDKSFYTVGRSNVNGLL